MGSLGARLEPRALKLKKIRTGPVQLLRAATDNQDVRVDSRFLFPFFDPHSERDVLSFQQQSPQGDCLAILSFLSSLNILKMMRGSRPGR